MDIMHMWIVWSVYAIEFDSIIIMSPTGICSIYIFLSNKLFVCDGKRNDNIFQWLHFSWRRNGIFNDNNPSIDHNFCPGRRRCLNRVFYVNCGRQHLVMNTQHQRAVNDLFSFILHDDDDEDVLLKLTWVNFNGFATAFRSVSVAKAIWFVGKIDRVNCSP